MVASLAAVCPTIDQPTTTELETAGITKQKYNQYSRREISVMRAEFPEQYGL